MINWVSWKVLGAYFNRRRFYSYVVVFCFLVVYFASPASGGFQCSASFFVIVALVAFSCLFGIQWLFISFRIVLKGSH